MGDSSLKIVHNSMDSYAAMYEKCSIGSLVSLYAKSVFQGNFDEQKGLMEVIKSRINNVANKEVLIGEILDSITVKLKNRETFGPWTEGLLKLQSEIESLAGVCEHSPVSPAIIIPDNFSSLEDFVNSLNVDWYYSPISRIEAYVNVAERVTEKTGIPLKISFQRIEYGFINIKLNISTLGGTVLKSFNFLSPSNSAMGVRVMSRLIVEEMVDMLKAHEA